MTRVYQKTENDCLSACIASILDLSLDEVPLWWDLPDHDWLTALPNWLAKRGLGFAYLELRKDKVDWPLLSGYVIVGGFTPRSAKFRHAVIAKAEMRGNQVRLNWIHDPYKRGNFLEDPDHVICLTARGEDL